VGSVDPIPATRFLDAAQAAGCDVVWISPDEIMSLPLVEGAVISQRALERHSELPPRSSTSVERSSAR